MLSPLPSQPDHTLAFIGGILIPHRPHLDAEERRPAGDIGQHNDQGHLHSSDLGPRDGADAANPGRQPPCGCDWATRSGWPIPRAPAPSFGLPSLCLDFEVLADFVADEAVAGCEHGHRQDEDGQGGPGDVGPWPPRKAEVCPAVQHSRALDHLLYGKNEDLRETEDGRQQPGGGDERVGGPAGLLEAAQGVTDGQVAVQRHGQQHVGGSKHAQHLQVLDGPAERVGAPEAVGDVPQQLGQHLEERHAQVGQGQVQHEHLHAGALADRPAHRQQHRQVAPCGQHQDGGQDADLHLGQLLIPAQPGCGGIGGREGAPRARSSRPRRPGIHGGSLLPEKQAGRRGWTQSVSTSREAGGMRRSGQGRLKMEERGRVG